MFKNLMAGRQLFKIWPREPKLNLVFRAGYLVKVLEFANMAVPAALAFLGVWYFMLYHYYPETSDIITLPSIGACMLFLLFLPLLGYQKLGNFALTALPPAHLKWYHLVCERGCLTPVAAPNYMVLATTVAKLLTKDHIDRSFLDEI